MGEETEDIEDDLEGEDTEDIEAGDTSLHCSKT